MKKRGEGGKKGSVIMFMFIIFTAIHTFMIKANNTTTKARQTQKITKDRCMLTFEAFVDSFRRVFSFPSFIQRVSLSDNGGVVTQCTKVFLVCLTFYFVCVCVVSE